MKQAVILAAGEGQRLRPFTASKSKVMLSIAGKPLLEYVIESLALNGIRDIILVVGYQRERIFDYFGQGGHLGVQITYVHQPNQLGTAHALKQANDKIKGDFLVLNGDQLIKPSTISEFAKQPPQAVMVKAVNGEDPRRYGVITSSGGLLTSIEEKPSIAKSSFINTGIYSFSMKVFDYIGEHLDIPVVLQSMIKDKLDIQVAESHGLWLDIVYPWDMLSLNAAVSAELKPGVAGTIESGVVIKGPVLIGKNTVIRSNSYITGPVIIGEGCDIGPSVCIYPSSSIADNVTVAPFCQIKNSLIYSGNSIGVASVIEDSVIDRGCVLRGQFNATSSEVETRINDELHKIKVGTMMGEGCIVGNSVVSQSGTVVGNSSRIAPLKTLSGSIPDGSLVV
ncbi:bifunctional sugar-1-phosphate nucleotidylyltransferase/acetyltransferase [Dehalococcoides mccartyi]|uniref:bifunctional sugar-1-phosphate nucleotidylyltransferase/acetyltransferase n=1 Tax=Dehalococcoides mccartyi TaxID=61435 RepID=UPI0003C88665|nr:bifunctional sugar-1-phosphate nucleotidylyltransferase/acetyltransferase [Dehalococcoides mccartyi]AHB13239.1 nucleotidyl transferase [Dehalococcoides mccartyi GY50]